MPSKEDIPFDLKEVNIDFNSLLEILSMCRSGVPPTTAFKAVGLYERYRQIRTIARYDIDVEHDDTRCYVYVHLFYNRALADVAVSIFKQATDTENKSSVNAAKLLLEYNELLRKQGESDNVL